MSNVDIVTLGMAAAYTNKVASKLSEEIDALKGGGTVTETVTKTGKFLSIEANAGTEITVNADATGTVTLVHCGKNIMPPMRAETFAEGGMTFTKNADNTITLTGEVTASGWPNYINPSTPVHIPAGSYVLKADGVDEYLSFAMMRVDRTKEFVCGKMGDGLIYPTVSITLDEGIDVYFYFTVRKGAAYTNKIVSVQLNCGNAATDYTPCSMVEYAESTLPKTLIANAGVNYIYTKTEDVLTASYGIEKNAPTNGVSNFDAKQYGLPVLTLEGNCTGMTKDDYVPLAVSFPDKDGNDVGGTAEVAKQGSSSMTIGAEIGGEFDTELGGLFNLKIKFPVAFEAVDGWGAHSKYYVKVYAIDHSHIRDVGSQKHWADITRSHSDAPDWLKALPNCGAIDGFPVIIVINGEYYALGSFNIPKDGWMAGEPEAILSAKTHCDATRFKALATLDGDFELEYIKDETNQDWLLPSINAAIQAVMNSDGTDLAAVGQYVDFGTATDHMIHAVNEDANDCTDKNYLLITKDKVKWYFIPYDKDTIYGLHWTGKSFSSPEAGISFKSYAEQHAVMGLIYNYKKAELKARAIELREGVTSEAHVTTLYTNLAASIPSEVLAQNAKRWPLLRSTNAANLAQLLNWYRLRRAHVDKEIDSWTV